MSTPMSAQMVEKVVVRLRALADETRVRLILRLKRGECNVTELSAEVGVEHASASKHLSILRHAGFVEVRRQGTQAIYAIQDESIFELCELVCQGVVRQANAEHTALGLGKRAVLSRRVRRVSRTPKLSRGKGNTS